jgi:putative phosphoribosyl transferase
VAFRDRRDAGVQLAERLRPLALEDPVVLALPRGGVPVAAVVAEDLGATLDVLVARKVGAPGHEELGIGAVAEEGPVVRSVVADQLGVGPTAFAGLAERARAEVDRRVARYRGDRPLPPVAGRDVVLVDDGLATGVTAEAGLAALRGRGPRRLVLAAPTAARDTVARLRLLADDVVVVATPEPFHAVGLSYERFDQTTDDEVLALLAQARRRGDGG